MIHAHVHALLCRIAHSQQRAIAIVGKEFLVNVQAVVVVVEQQHVDARAALQGMHHVLQLEVRVRVMVQRQTMPCQEREGSHNASGTLPKVLKSQRISTLQYPKAPQKLIFFLFSEIPKSQCLKYKYLCQSHERSTFEKVQLHVPCKVIIEK